MLAAYLVLFAAIALYWLLLHHQGLWGQQEHPGGRWGIVMEAALLLTVWCIGAVTIFVLARNPQ